MFKQVYLARYFDVRLIKEKRRGRLKGTLYSSHNQDAILVGSLFGLKPTDWISPIHRDMPAFFLKDCKIRLASCRSTRDEHRRGLRPGLGQGRFAGTGTRQLVPYRQP